MSGFFAGSETALVSLGPHRPPGDARAGRPARRHDPRAALSDLEAPGGDPDRPESLPLGRLGLGHDRWRSGWFGPKYGIVAAVLFSTVTLFIFAEMMPKAIGAASPVSVARAVAVPLSWMMKVLSPIAALCVALTNRTLRVLGVAEQRLGPDRGGAQERLQPGRRRGRHPRRGEAASPQGPRVRRQDRPRHHGAAHQGRGAPGDRQLPGRPGGPARAQVLAPPGLPRHPGQRRRRPERQGPLRPDRRRGDELRAEPPLRPAVSGAGVQARGGPLPRDAPPAHAHGDRRRRTRRHRRASRPSRTSSRSCSGQIQDEYDEEPPGFEPAGERTYLLEGSFRLDDLEEQFGFSLPRDEAETIAGHLILRFGRIPRKGERWKGRFADFLIEEATPTAVQKIRMVLPPVPAPVPARRSREHA